ncbi:MAG TPA: MerR family transcriptional regulator [Blastocatellia bacterium]|nr:MerR family transcriptional regulator [Blastocatellia bacterium]
MQKMARRWYQASEFARLAGVTVRTLHHYDRLGLLKPSGHTAAGYRLYGERDFARLQQIVTLKFIGFSLKQIKDLLDRDSFDLAAALRLQRQILAEKRRHLDLAVRAIERAESALAASGEPDREAFVKIIEVIHMQNDKEWVMNYYSEEARRELEERGKLWTPELQAKAEQDWAALGRDLEAAVKDGVDPASERAQALAARYNELIEGFTGGSPAIMEGLKKLYADKANWPTPLPMPYGEEAGEFIQKAMAVRKDKSGS